MIFRTLMLLALCASSVCATPILYEVLVDPTGTQSGGEAVLLFNPEDVVKDISGWGIRTGSTTRDVTFPESTMLCGGCSYLVADTGWSTKRDNTSWPEAAHEETMTLVNSNSGVALIDTANAIRDVLSWGDEELIPEPLRGGFSMVNPADGMSFRRVVPTSEAPFIMNAPLFTTPNQILDYAPVRLDVRPALNVSIPDDDSKEGIQWRPNGSTRIMEIRFLQPLIRATFDGKAVQEVNGTLHILLEPDQSPGLVALVLEVRDENQSYNVSFQIEVVEYTKVAIVDVELSVLDAQASLQFGVENRGNTRLNVGYQIEPLTSRVGVLDLVWNCTQSTMNMNPSDKTEIDCSSVVPNTVPGTYTGYISLNAI